MDDVRERHGVQAEGGFVDAREGESHVAVAVSDGINPVRKTALTPEAALRAGIDPAARGRAAALHQLAPQADQEAERTSWRKTATSASAAGSATAGTTRTRLTFPTSATPQLPTGCSKVDPFWSWEPVAWTPEGLPRFDASGGMWIRLTVAGMTRLGYGHGAQKPGQDPGAREKEVIGDALRNAAMRFGVALELWHKGELHPDGEGATDEVDDTPTPMRPPPQSRAPEGTVHHDEQRDRILEWPQPPASRRGRSAIATGSTPCPSSTPTISTR
jgi:hypothetical protein